MSQPPRDREPAYEPEDVTMLFRPEGDRDAFDLSLGYRPTHHARLIHVAPEGQWRLVRSEGTRRPTRHSTIWSALAAWVQEINRANGHPL